MVIVDGVQSDCRMLIFDWVVNTFIVTFLTKGNLEESTLRFSCFVTELWGQLGTANGVDEGFALSSLLHATGDIFRLFSKKA